MDRELADLRKAIAAVQKMRIRAQYELDQLVKTRMEAEQYLRDTRAKANSLMQQLFLSTRLTVKKEVDEIRLQAVNSVADEKSEISEKAMASLQQEIEEFREKMDRELAKALADIRMIRMAAHEELQVQRKLADAAKIKSLSIDLPEAENVDLLTSRRT